MALWRLLPIRRSIFSQRRANRILDRAQFVFLA
jgi:hypothetical protein